MTQDTNTVLTEFVARTGREVSKLSKDTETHKCSLGIELCIKLVEEKLNANNK